jgi:multidrug resistance efflux pump
MKRALIVAAAIIVVAAVVFGVWHLLDRENPETTSTTVPPVVQAESVVVDGTVLPVNRAELAFSVAGRVSVVAVAEGDTVSAQQPLVSLDDTAARAAVSAAEADVAAAQAGIEQAEAGVEGAQASVDKAKATRDGLSDNAADWRFDAADADIALAEAQLRAAEADVSAAGARLAAARARAEQARSALADLTIEAPFSGTVTSLTIKMGDQVTPTLVVVRVADLSSWEIETIDLDEASVEAVEKGARVELTFDALPDVTASGVVTEVGLFGHPYQGTMVFPLTVVPDGAIEGLRWGLTATVEIMTPAE